MGIVEALKAIHQAGFLAVVVTNQAGVARGKYPESDIAKVHEKLQALLAACGERIDAFYYCPHHPEHTGECSCRKPNPGMLLQAAEELDIDISHSLMIGDRMSDMKAGFAAGCAKGVHVLSGFGMNEKDRELPENYLRAENLLEAVRLLLKN